MTTDSKDMEYTFTITTNVTKVTSIKAKSMVKALITLLMGEFIKETGKVGSSKGMARRLMEMN